MSSEKPVHVPRDKYPDAMYPESITTLSVGEYEQEERTHVLDYWRVVVARRWTILAILSTALTTTLLYTFKQTPIYRATASIQIDKENQNVLSFKDVYDIETATDDTLRTQFEVLKSRLLARRVVEELKLDKVEEFQADQKSFSTAFVTYFRNLWPDTGKKQQDPLLPILDAYTYRLTVAPVRQARLVNISFESKDPELAARIINAHAKNFIDQNLRFKVEATEAASDFLQENLIQLKEKLEKAEDQLQQYSRQNQILFTEEGKNTATEKLRQLEEGYTKAQEDRIQKESYYRLIENGHSDALPQLIDNKLIEDLTSKLVDLERQDSELAVTFQPGYPMRQRLSGQITQLHKSIETENARIITTVQSEYSAALEREQLIGAELDKQRNTVNKINEDIIQYNIYKGDAESVRQLYDGLQKRLKEASVSAGLTASNIRIVDRAEIPPLPVRPQKALNSVVGLFIGLLLGVGLAFFQEYLDNSVKAPEDVSRYFNLPTLGMIPRLGSLSGKTGYGGYGYGSAYGPVQKLDASTTASIESNIKTVDMVVHESPSSLMAEAYRSIRTSVLLSSSGKPPRTIVVTSAIPSEGKTTTAINLAISLTQTGAKVVLIDADMRRPRIQNVFRVDGTAGLSSFLAGTSSLRDVICKTIIPGLLLVPCGLTPPNPSELILSVGFRRMLETLREYFDFVVLDSPPVANVSDARILSVAADATILVVRAFSTSRHYVSEAVGHLTTARARVAGVVLNDVDVRRRSYYSGYSNYSTYHSGYTGGYGPKAKSGSPTSAG